MKKGWMNLWISVAMAASLQAATCKERSFSLTTQDSGISAEEVIKQLALECSYSILLRDEEARARLKADMPALNIQNAPLERVFDLVLKENGLAYEFDDSVLKISYLVTKTFKINYVGTDRSGSSSTEVAISRDDSMSASSSSSSSASGSSSTEASSSGGKSGITIKAEDGFRFWEGIQEEIMAILNRPGDSYALPALPAQPLQPLIPQAVEVSGAGAASETMARPTRSLPGAVIVNRGAGLVTVTGTPQQIERVSQYIEKLHERLQSQVMIDVSILTVRHSNGQTTGIDWNQLYNLQNISLQPRSSSSGGGGGESSGSTSIKREDGGLVVEHGDASALSILGLGRSADIGYAVNVFSQGVSLTRVIEFLQTYGGVTSVSNPKVLTLNNQPAMISVGNIIRYRKNTVFQTSGNSTGTNTNTDTEYPSVFAGVLLDITPSVFNDEIMLKINPSITQTKSMDIENASTALDVPPNLSTNQLSSLVRVKDGQKIVLGGLISKGQHKKENKLPILGDIPLLGYFFSHKSDIETTDEMVIVITPHIVKQSQTPSLQELGYKLMKE